MESMFSTLMELAGSPSETDEPHPVGSDVRALACACLLSFVVALGDTGKLLQATAATLMSPKGFEKIVMPGILVSLQRSVLSVMLGQKRHPNFLTGGVLKSSVLDSFPVHFGGRLPSFVYGMASDGSFLYLHTCQGLFKVGSGYGGTVKGRVYLYQSDFEARPGWLLHAQGHLYFKVKSHEPEEDGSQVEMDDDFKYELYRIDCETLLIIDVITVKDASFEASPHVLFSDGTHLGVVSLTSNDNFVIKFLNVGTNPMTCVQETPLKLARKCVSVYGASAFDESSKEHQLEFGSPSDEVMDIQSGKEFSLLFSSQGKVYYTGKSSAMGHKQNGPPGQWQELTISRTPQITQIAIGHDGQHALILTEDGNVYFTGTARRGEDGDQTKNRRQPKSFKPKRIERLDGIRMVQVACNNGTSAMISREGELFVFGKDSSHADYSTGLVGDLKNVVVTQVAIGKAHLVVLSKSGEVYTFGMNNKGQCGRDFPSSSKDGITAAAAANNAFNNATAAGGAAAAGGASNGATAVISTDLDDPASDPDLETDQRAGDLFSICPADQHKWKHDQCMVCVVCGECTGYGSSCVSSGRPDRNAGMLCGCGSGDSGCAECGICRTCSGEELALGGVLAPQLNEIAEARMAPRAAEGLVDDFLRVRELSQFLEMNYMQGGEFKDMNVQPIHHNDLRRLKLFRRQSQKMLSGGRRSRRYAERDKKDGQARLDDMMALKVNESRNKEQNPNSAGTSDVEKEAGKLASLPPAKVSLPSRVKIVQISCGLHHTLLLSSNGDVFAFGSNTHGQLGVGDFIPRGKPTKLILPTKIAQVTAGGYHSVLLSTSGEVLTFGLHQKGQLGRSGPVVGEVQALSSEGMAAQELWFAHPEFVPNIGSKFGRTATWVGASDYQTFIKIDESLINAKSLLGSTVLADERCLLLVPNHSDQMTTFNSLSINKSDGFCRSFEGPEQESFKNRCSSLDPQYHTLWAYDHDSFMIKSYLPAMSDYSARMAGEEPTKTATIISPELALPMNSEGFVSRNHASLNILSCLDVLNQFPDVNLSALDDETQKPSSLKSLGKDDFLSVNRFDSHGGGWGYSGHSIEAIRFMADTDILIGGYGLFGGRGEYIGKIKLFDIGMEGGELETDGELIGETEEITYECGSRQKYPILFDEPIPIQAGRWYIAWARVSGPSSDCGSLGQSQITTEEQIQFTFKSSRKSNNGTDVNAGQVPQLIYKVMSNESQSLNQRMENLDPICVLSQKFARSVTPECFQSLLNLIQWSWNAFKSEMCELLEADEDASQAIILDLERLVFICRACLRLIVTFTHEVYPVRILPNGPRPVPESQKLAESVYETKNILQSILRDNLPGLEKVSQILLSSSSQLKSCQKMTNIVLSDAHRTFVACFHSFFPTGYLKWACLCNLLASIEGSSSSHQGLAHDRLLAAVLDALCSPMVKLRNTFPITYSPETETRCKNLSPTENLSVTASMIQAGDSQSHRFPILNELMNYQSHLDGVKFASWSFREVLDRLLAIVSLPVKQALRGEPIGFSRQLEEKSGQVISAVIAELANQTISSEDDIQNLGGKILSATPNRFIRTSNTRMWNTGNGSPDAICFSVDKPGIFIMGCCVFGGTGSYTYELELLYDQTANEKEANRQSQSQRWHSLEISQGIYSSDECATETDLIEIKFERAVPIKPNTKYALRLRNHGGRTNNGDGGVSSVKGPDGTTFVFSSCSLSFNGTNPTRGQLPQILYFSSPQENDVQSSTKSMAELYSRRTALSMISTIVKTITNLLVTARDSIDEKGLDILNSAPVINKLMPHVFASVTNLVRSDPPCAVQVLSYIQDMLPSVSALNNLVALNSDSEDSATVDGVHSRKLDLSHPRYAWVESEHPYKTATVSNNRVVFPKSVQWMSVEFDPQCATSQPEDTLQIYIQNPNSSLGTSSSGSGGMKPKLQGSFNKTPILASPTNANESQSLIVQQKYIPVLKKFSGMSGWPCQAVILPGNEIMFSLETASDYVKDEKKINQFGYKCLVVGYEALNQRENGLHNLEWELAYLGGLCAASLMQKNIPLNVSEDAADEDMEVIEEAAVDAFEMHPVILSKGFALTHPPSVHQALDGVIPFNCNSHERVFLKNLVHCTQGTSGARLARWLQPESYVDVDQCKVLINPNELKCSWPTIITIVTQDQYGEVVHVPNMKVEVKAVPIDEMNQSGSKVRKLTAPDSMTFGGHRLPNLEHKYEVTVKDKMFYHAITIQKCYDNYSFEELRFASPKLQRQSENMLVRAHNNGTYSANWAPGNVGIYRIYVIVDGSEMSEHFKADVQEPPKGIIPPPKGMGPKNPSEIDDKIYRLRKFVAKPSAGLRIRVHPTLQSEQIGIVPVDGTVSIVDELHNSDGIWVRLSTDCLAEMAPHHVEGWCLQYNQHLEKTLMIPVADVKPKDLAAQNPPPNVFTPQFVEPEMFSPGFTPNEALMGRFDRKREVTRGPGNYTVMKCGPSGHNIRTHPSLSASPMGRLNLGSVVNVVEVKSNDHGELWVRLDSASADRHSFVADGGEAWALAVSSTDVQYLESEAEIEETRLRHAYGMYGIPVSQLQPIPQTMVQQLMIPSVKARPQKSLGTGVVSRRKSEGTSGPSRNAPAQLELLGSSGDNRHYETRSLERPTPSPRPSLTSPGRRQSSPSSPRRTPSPVGGDSRKPSFFQKFFRNETGRRGASASPPIARKPVFHHVNKDIPPELQGVSVKELVKVIGESRANGNGVTPPTTPKTKRKAHSRSSSPQVIGSSVSSRSSSPIAIRSNVAHSKSPLSRSPQSLDTNSLALGRQDSSQSDTSALVSSLTRDISQSPNTSSHDSPLLSLKSEHGPQPRPVAPHTDLQSGTSVDLSEGSEGALSMASGPIGNNSLMTTSVSGAQASALFMSTTSLETSGSSIRADLDLPQHLHKSGARSSSPPPVSPRVKKRTSGKSSSSSGASFSSRAPPTVRYQPSLVASDTFVLPKGPVKEAMSPSVAESIRAVFAAFVWHEGIVHDTMAVASYLKFHPSLKKNQPDSTPSSSPSTATLGATTMISRNESGETEDKKVNKQRHSVEVLSTSYLKAKSQGVDQSAMNANTNRNITILQQQRIPEESYSPVTSRGGTESHLPPTLSLLVVIWEDIRSYCKHAIFQQVILASPLHGLPSMSSTIRSGLKNDRHAKDRKSSSSSSNAPMGVSSPNVSGKRIKRKHPVTYHMRTSHPGCGNPAGGKGYNSGGNYCGGWAGNCGDGGVGGSSWYLICEKCREETMSKANLKPSMSELDPPLALSRARLSRAKSAKTGFSSLSSKLASPSGQLQSHVIMNNNAMFLLDLANASNSNLRPKNELLATNLSGVPPASQSSVVVGGARSKIPAHTVQPHIELSHFDPNPFPLVPFQCFNALGVQDKQFKSLNDELLDHETMIKSSEEHEILQHEAKKDPVASTSSAPHQRLSTLKDSLTEVDVVDQISPPAQFQTKLIEEPQGSSRSPSPSKRPFHRSVSMGGNQRYLQSASSTSQRTNVPLREKEENSWPENEIHKTSEQASPPNRKRNSTCCDTTNLASGMSETSNNSDFLSHPSQALLRLFAAPSSAVGSNSSTVGAKAAGSAVLGTTTPTTVVDVLQRPVMSFVLQWNDLESLQIAMTLALRKAACRTYAMQALNWLLRSVSQPSCLHDLLWCFSSALESPNELTNPNGPLDKSGAGVLNGASSLGPAAVPEDKSKVKKNKRNALLPSVKAADISPSKVNKAAPVFATKPKDLFSLSGLCEHPTSDIYIAGEAIQPLPETFHSVLKTVSDLMMVLPPGSPLQQIAIRCWGIKFKPSDHQFLHQSHIFPTISRMLSRPRDIPHHRDEVPSTSCAATSKNVPDLLSAYSGPSSSKLVEGHKTPLASLTFALDRCFVERVTDISSQIEMKVSSRQAMIGSLNDNSTETFWESGDEDRNKSKWITMSLPASPPGEMDPDDVLLDGLHFRNVSIHIDNGRDLANKVTSLTFKAGKALHDLQTIKQCEVESRFAGWISCFMDNSDFSVVKIELKGPDNTLRVRQVRALGSEPRDRVAALVDQTPEMSLIQKNNCEVETLRIFRLITSQVFGRLLDESVPARGTGLLPSSHHQFEDVSRKNETLSTPTVPSDFVHHQRGETKSTSDTIGSSPSAGPGSGAMGASGSLITTTSGAPTMGLMFTRSKLTHLQKQVCSHILLAIKKETAKFRAHWERSLCSGGKTTPLGEDHSTLKDTYCFEMLSMVLSLSCSGLGRGHLAQQDGLIQDVVSLLHIGSARIQKIVISLLTRLLPCITPQSFARVLGIPNLPPKDFGSLLSATRVPSSSPAEASSSLISPSEQSPPPVVNLSKPGIIDVFLSCIAKALTLQVKTKGKEGGGLGTKSLTTVSLASCIHPRGENIGDRWWLRGSISKKLAEEIILLVKNMSQGLLGNEWTAITKSAVAENILNLTRLEERHRDPSECLKYPVLWLALASLCVLDKDHVDGLSSGEYSAVGDNSPRPTCQNHDDGETLSIINCDHCGNLCGDCDRFLHLHRRTKAHQRQVFKEEEDAIKVDLHEGCGRAKLFWIMSLADSLTLKAMVEFREGSRGNCGTSGALGVVGLGTSRGGPMSNFATCRFCGRVSSSDSPVIDSLCTDRECIEFSRLACQKTLSCGHFCGGIADESNCLPCLHGCSGEKLRQDADDMCMICFTEALSPVPSILLECGHVFHYHCCVTVLEKRWIGPRITFGFRNCPICKSKIENESLRKFLDPIDHLYDDVRKKSLMRLEYDGLTKCEAIAKHHNNDPANYAIERYAYYVCFKCQKAYYGGEAQCDADAGQGDDYNPEELVCGGCSDVSQAQMCPKHGTDYLEYKCRYCCSVAVFFCFGTTHFCNACHDDFSRVANIPKTSLPQCPVGPKSTKLSLDECPLHVKHPPTGEEFALGCGLCRNAHTF
eukprot:TCALIF_10156-PA protein Name:"Similar to MYCBP2 E3 ubiquitin-protein ligase MYCBP2 (Homo sapiens)" AED:0.02 eAED:0.04 QI:14/0.77/0.5/1/0.88/0.8/10/0/4914